MYHVYILRCADGTYYTGWTNDLPSRERAHNEGKGARYTRGRGPVKLVYSETFATKNAAMRREYELKRLKRAKKAALVARCGPTRCRDEA